MKTLYSAIEVMDSDCVVWEEVGNMSKVLSSDKVAISTGIDMVVHKHPVS